MRFNNLINRINADSDVLSDWQEIREKIIDVHEQATTTDDRIALLSLYQALMDKVELQLENDIDIDKFKKARLQEYNQLILRECLIGDSVCVETLYNLTQRELEAGRMAPTHEFIEIAVDVSADSHYTREQLLRQEAKKQEIDSNSAFKKLSRFFKN